MSNNQNNDNRLAGLSLENQKFDISRPPSSMDTVQINPVFSSRQSSWDSPRLSDNAPQARNFNPVIGRNTPWNPALPNRVPSCSMGSSTRSNYDHNSPTQGRSSPWNAPTPNLYRPTTMSSNTTVDNDDVTFASGALDGYWDCLPQFKVLDREKLGFIRGLLVLLEERNEQVRDRNEQIRMYQALKSNATQDQLILQNQIRQLEVLLQDKPKAAEVPLKEELPVTEPVPFREPYVQVLIDASGRPFNEELVMQGHDGGRAAAQGLRDLISSSVLSRSPDHEVQPTVVVRVFADLEKVPDSLPMKAFVKGFNAVDSLMDFVDTDRFQTKLIESYHTYLRNPQYSHIFIGGIADATYEPLLQNIAHSELSMKRTTLLVDSWAARPDEWSNFTIENVDYLFSTFVRRMESPRIPKPASATTWASTVKNAKAVTVPTPVQADVPARKTTPVISGASYDGISRNIKGQRIDPVVPHDRDEVDRIKKKKLCNTHYLKTACPYGEKCAHDHTYKMRPGELKTLELVARMAPCIRGNDCKDPTCIHGHCCPAPEGRKGNLCIFGSSCHFSDDMHKMDRKVVKTVKI